MTAKPHTLTAALRFTVRAHPERIAFYFRDRTWTYGELEDGVARCAGGLHRLGLRPGDACGLVLRNCPEFVVLFFALCRLGAVAVPVNFLEKGEKLGYIFADAGVKACLTSKEFLKQVHEAQKKAPHLRHVFVREPAGHHPTFESLLAGEGGSFEEPALGGDALAMLIYTAGTTGNPKGVMLTHGNFLANVESCHRAIEVGPEDRFLCLLPMFHSFSWTVNVLLPIRLGATIVILETLLPFEPVLKTIWDRKITVFCGVPPIFAALTQKIPGWKALLVRFLNPVRVAISGASPLPAAVHREFEAKFRRPLIEGYGLTEASPVVAVNPLHKERKPGTVGLPLPGVHVKIIDDYDRPCPTGEVGEVCVKGANVMAGYFKHPEETRAAVTEDGWLKTGDLGCLDAQGYLTIVDRKKDLIIVKGLNVYPQEVEAVLTSHPDVAEAAVVGVPDETGDETVLAFAAAHRGKTLDTAALLSLCREKLASYKAPKELFVKTELPKNAMGKVLKKELRQEAARLRRRRS